MTFSTVESFRLDRCVFSGSFWTNEIGSLDLSLLYCMVFENLLLIRRIRFEVFFSETGVRVNVTVSVPCSDLKVREFRLCLRVRGEGCWFHHSLFNVISMSYK